MAIDFLIFGFLLISFTINLLPLGAFWVTPGLRTTANRFVINLLIINLIGCCILAPTLYLSGDMLATVEITDESLNTIEKGKSAELHSLTTTTHRSQLIEQSSIDGIFRNKSERTEMTFHCNLTHCEKLTVVEERGERIVITELHEKSLNNIMQFRDNPKILESTSMMRCWSIDLAAALGALSVLLVVGDTWMAVRDPLRYHSRISGVKSWILIALTWILGILFGVMSALREINFQCDGVIERKRNGLSEMQMQVFSTTNSTIFSMIFACIYFIVIILLPFGFVCGMYWRIFSEAKENGLRMRQNGSSPLLQSATNLSHSSHEQRNAHLLMQRRSSITSTTACGSGGNGGGGGLHFQIDRKRNHKDSIVKIADVKKPTTQSTLPPLSEPEESLTTDEENANISSMPLPSPTSKEFKRNYSARQLPHLSGKSSQDNIDSNRLNTFRQIKSTPNLQKHNHQAHRNSLSGLETTFHLRNMPHQSLHNPTMTNASPKSLSYMTSIRRRLSNASSLFKQREESRAARISILVVIMFLVSYLPYGLLVLLQDRLIDNFPHSTQLAVFMILLANFSSPFIFAYRNKRVRHGVTRLFGLDARSKDHRLQCKGIFLRYGTKARISVKRSSSKVSAYSMNSCKYLTPILKHTNRSLKTKNEEQKHEANTFLESVEVESCLEKSPTENSIKSDKIDVVDTTVTIQPDEPVEKFSIFNVFCKSSKTANCTTQSCTAETMDV